MSIPTNPEAKTPIEITIYPSDGAWDGLFAVRDYLREKKRSELSASAVIEHLLTIVVPLYFWEETSAGRRIPPTIERDLQRKFGRLMADGHALQKVEIDGDFQEVHEYAKKLNEAWHFKPTGYDTDLSSDLVLELASAMDHVRRTLGIIQSILQYASGEDVPARRSEKLQYTPENLIKMFRKAAKLRNEMIRAGFTDNGGAIHSAERILDILGQKLNYPGLTHINNLRNYGGAKFSKAALDALRKGGKVFIEHVSPVRAFTREAINRQNAGATNDELLEYVRQHYELVLLSGEERKRLDRQNRSRMTNRRLADARIEVKIAKDWISEGRIGYQKNE